MQTENVEIVTTKEKFFQEYLILKKPVIDALLSSLHKKKSTLNDIPLRVLAQLLYYNDQYQEYPDMEKWDMVFSKKTKDQICENLGMKEHHLNIYLSQLRALRILEKKSIRKAFIIYANESRSLNFIFKINGHS